MAKALVDDELWALIEPILPAPKPRHFRYPGRRPLSNRAVLNGIIFVLRTGIRWIDLPAELGRGGGKRCRERLRDWHEAGVWVALHAVLLAELHHADKIDWSRATLDSSKARALNGGDARNCGHVASRPRSPDADRRMAAAWESIVPWPSRCRLGCTALNGCAPATSAPPSCTKPSCLWPAV